MWTPNRSLDLQSVCLGGPWLRAPAIPWPLSPNYVRREPDRLLHGDVRHALDLDRDQDHPSRLRVDAAPGSRRAEEEGEWAALVGDHEGPRRERRRAALEPFPLGALADSQ